MAWLSRVTYLLAAGIATAAPAQDFPIDQFFRHGPTFACVVPKEFVADYPCRRIGPLRVGQTEAEVEKIVGKPWKVINQDAKTTQKVYPIESQERPLPYWVVAFVSGRA